MTSSNYQTIKIEIIRDLKIINSPNSSNADRLQSQKRIDLLVKGGAGGGNRQFDLCRDLGLELATNNNNMNVTMDSNIIRFFGMQLMAASISSMSTSSSSTTPDHIMTLFKSLKDSDPAFIKEKACFLFVELAKRTWPVTWQDMDLLLRSMYSTDASTIHSNALGNELVLKIYKRLIEDVFLFEDTAAQARKQELSTSLLATCIDASSLNKWIEKERASEDTYKTKADLDTLLQIIRADAGNIGWMSRFTAGLKAAVDSGLRSSLLLHLECLDAFLYWIPVSTISESNLHYILLEIVLSRSPASPSGSPAGVVIDLGIKEVAMDCLLTLCGRNFRPLDTDSRLEIIWTPLFSQGYLGRLIEFWAFLHSAPFQTMDDLLSAQSSYIPSDEALHRLVKKIAQLTASVASLHICFKRNTNSCPENFASFLQFILVLSTHPSCFVSGWALDCIHDCLRHDYIKTLLLVDNVSLSILESVTKCLGRKPDSQSHVYQAYTQLDFDSRKDESMAIAHTNLRRVEIIRILATALTIPVYDWIDGHVRLLFTNQSVVFGISELALCLEAVLGAIPVSLIKDQESRNPHLYNSTSTLLDGILSLEIVDVSIVVFQLPMLASFSPFMPAFPNLLFRCMEKFFALCSFTQPHEQAQINSSPSCSVESITLSDETIMVRRKASSALVKLGSSNADVFIPIMDQIAPAIMALASSNKLLKTESRILLEFLINIVSGSCLPLQKKGEYLAAVLGQQVLSLEAFVEPLSSRDAFYRVLVPFPFEAWVGHVGSPSPLGPTVLARFEELDRWRRNFCNEILSFRHWIKKSHECAKKAQADISLLWQPYIPKILSICLQLISHIHSLWNPITWNILPVQIKKITTLTPFEKVMAIGVDAENVKGLNSSETGNPLDEQIFRLWSWIGRSRDACYQLFNTLALFPVEFYESGAVPDVLMNALFADAKYISLHHWRSLLQTTMIPFVLHCPSQLYVSVLGSVLPALTMHLNEQLAAAWTPENLVKFSTQAAQEDEDDVEAEDLTEEMIFEKSLRSFTRSYADFWSSIFLMVKNSAVVSSSATTPATQQFRYQDLVQFCLTSPELVQQWTMALVSLLGVKDTASCHQALKTCIALVQPLAFDASAHSFLGQVLLRAVLQVLADGYQKSNHAEALHLIVDIYCTLRPLTEIPYFTLSQLNGMKKQGLDKFENDVLAEKATMKSKLATAKSFFAAFHGLEVSEWGRERAQDFVNLKEKQLFAKTEKSSNRASLLDVQDVDNTQSVLGNLFEN